MVQGAAGIADILFGKTSPSGKLPVTFYYDNYTTIQTMSNMDMRSWPGRTYRCPAVHAVPCCTCCFLLSFIVPSAVFQCAKSCAVLRCVVLCCAVPCHAVLRCAVLSCAVPCCSVLLCCAVLCCAVLCCAVLCWAVLCCAVLCCDVLQQA